MTSAPAARRARIDRGDHARLAVKAKPVAAPRPVVDLMAALKRSLSQAGEVSAENVRFCSWSGTMNDTSGNVLLVRGDAARGAPAGAAWTDEVTQICHTAQVEISSIHLPKNRLRRLQREIVKTLAASMVELGQLHPITLAPDHELIAGLHRIEAAKLLGWTTIGAKIVASDSPARLIEIDENLVRADLSPAERAAHQAERKRLYEERHPETRSVNVRGGPGRGHHKTNDKVSPVSYTEDAAKVQRASQRTVQREAARGEAIANVARLAGTSLDSGKELDATAKLPPQRREEVIARAVTGEKVSASQELKKTQREEREQELAERTAAATKTLNKRRYNVILADPWEPRSREIGMDRAADNHYQTMPLDEIKALKVPAADDCVSFLWATIPMLPQALEVMAAWGFTYKSQFVWVKDKIGPGIWVREQHELLLIGTRGNIPAPAPGDQFPSAVHAPRMAHSEKPPVFYEMIAKMFPTLPRLEMFSRGSPVGWDQHGNEAGEASTRRSNGSRLACYGSNDAQRAAGGADDQRQLVLEMR